MENAAVMREKELSSHSARDHGGEDQVGSVVMRCESSGIEGGHMGGEELTWGSCSSSTMYGDAVQRVRDATTRLVDEGREGVAF
jgi:hypothetical protein